MNSRGLPSWIKSDLNEIPHYLLKNKSKDKDDDGDD